MAHAHAADLSLLRLVLDVDPVLRRVRSPGDLAVGIHLVPSTSHPGRHGLSRRDRLGRGPTTEELLGDVLEEAAGRVEPQLTEEAARLGQ